MDLILGIVNTVVLNEQDQDLFLSTSSRPKDFFTNCTALQNNISFRNEHYFTSSNKSGTLSSRDKNNLKL